MLGDTTVALTYKSKNQLISAGTTTYQHDVDGNRIQVTDANRQTTYVYDTTGSISRMLMSIDEVGNITKYIYGNGLIAQENSNGYYSYHYDMRGSTTALTNETGTVTDTYQYDTYGEATQKTGTHSLLFQYNGWDGVVTDSNDLLYMRARYYSPQ